MDGTPVVFQFGLPPDEFVAALKRNLLQAHDGLRFSNQATQVKFLYPPHDVLARGNLTRSKSGGTRLELEIPFRPSYRIMIHAPLGLIFAVVGFLRPDTSLGPVAPVVIGLLVFVSSLVGLFFNSRRTRDRIETILSHRALEPIGPAPLGLDEVS